MITDTLPIAVEVGLVGSPGKMKRWRRNRKCHDRDAKYKNRRDYKNNIFTYISVVVYQVQTDTHLRSVYGRLQMNVSNVLIVGLVTYRWM